jgi:hypothetical protein
MHTIVSGNLKRRLLWRLGYKWEDNFNMDLNDIGCENVD